MTGTAITDEGLHKQIALHNRFRETVRRIYGMNTGLIPAFSGMELTLVTASGGFECNLPERICEMESAMDLADKRLQSSGYRRTMSGRTRILLTGCPTTNKKVLHLVENSGASVVAMETCGGLKTAGSNVDETGDPLSALTRRYLKTPCACMTPNTDRVELIAELASEFQVDGVIELTWEACHTYNIESVLIERAVSERIGLLYLNVQTDYSEHDTGQLKTRIEAFLEMISDD